MSSILDAVECLRRGGIIAVPTETVYGLAVDAFNNEAIERLYDLKQRPELKPFVFQVRNIEQAQRLVATTFTQEQIVFLTTYWPGAVTFIFDRHPLISSVATGGGDTIAIRVSGHSVMKALVEAYENPIVVPSANLSGKSPATFCHEVRDIFGMKIDCYLENSEAMTGISSTIVDIRSEYVNVLRHGDVIVRPILT